MPSNYSPSHEQLLNISPIDGRYFDATKELREIFSEFGLIRFRYFTELRWFRFLAGIEGVTKLEKLTPQAHFFLEELEKKFSLKDAVIIKMIEKETIHDVKAVELCLRQQFLKHKDLANKTQFIHFCCTSEDINSTAYALMLKKGVDTILTPQFRLLEDILRQMKNKYAQTPILARTHGQAAIPTTFGKECSVFYHRLKKQVQVIKSIELHAKFSGAVGNFSSHSTVYPNIDWISTSQVFLRSLGLAPNIHTTQIEPHDDLAALLDAISRICNIIIDLCRDFWGYISRGILELNTSTQEVGSSTMPQKINPVDFENAEGNLGLAAAICHHLSSHLPISRWQRDLCDSTLMRNIGIAFAYFLLGIKRAARGLGKVDIQQETCQHELSIFPEIKAEAIQTVLRKNGHSDAYEKLKELVQGKSVTTYELYDFIGTFRLPPDDLATLQNIIHTNTTGLAEELALRDE